MSTKQQSKAKLNEVAKDLGITNQELIDFMAKELDSVKKPTASLTAEEMTYVLEYYSQHNQVDSFNEYFAAKTAPAKKEEPKKETAKKDSPAKKKKTEEKPADNKQAAKDKPKQKAEAV
ncbi:MAG: translation initiation factor IF-2 N-terminal domain-containing protein, partial [Oscillospiraceae bacterium]